jgi:uroporphyrinogen decarboxylase
MTSRDRVLAAINHRPPDKVPVDLGATPSSGISAIAYTNLVNYLGIKSSGTKVYDVVQELAQVEDAIIDLFGIDVLDIGRTFNTGEKDWYEITLNDGSKAEYPKWFHPVENNGRLEVFDTERDMIAVKPPKAQFFDQACFPYIDGYPSDFKDIDKAMNKVLWQAMVHSPWDNASDPDFWTKLRERTLHLRETTDKALMIVAGCNLFEWGTFLRRIDNFLMDLYLQPAMVEKMLDALMEIHLAGLEKICNAVGDIVDILRMGDDLGTNDGPFMDPETYRKLFKPRHTMLNRYIKEHSKVHTYLHSCGSIYRLMPDLVDAGYEIINPVQTNAREMDPAVLKREFGKDVTFWGGGADTRFVLNKSTPEEVKKHVLERLEIFSPGGGYVFNTVHNILPDVPPQNIMAMLEAIKEFNGDKMEWEDINHDTKSD